MRTVETLLGDSPAIAAPYVLRPHRPGDMGWVVACHGRLYAREYAWDETFEALVAEIAARFIRRYKPQRERCWIAERDGENVGSVFVVEKSPTVAQLLIVDPPRAPALGGPVAERTWPLGLPQDDDGRTAHAARHLYEDAGFASARGTAQGFPARSLDRRSSSISSCSRGNRDGDAARSAVRVERITADRPISPLRLFRRPNLLFCAGGMRQGAARCDAPERASSTGGGTWSLDRRSGAR
jgi:hypothetical protein